MNTSYTRIVLLLMTAVAVMATTSCKKGCTDPNAINYNPDAKKDDGSCITVSESRKVSFFEYTATWCGPCGSWGADAFHEAIDDNPGKVVGMAIHASSSDPMYNSVADEFYNNFTITGWPNFWVGNTFMATNTNITSEVANYFAMDLEANAVILVTKTSDTEWEVKVQVRFFKNVTGEYYVAVYLTEDGIDGSDAAGAYDQNGAGTPYTHDHVLRASANGLPWGEQIVSSSATADFVVTKTYNVTIDADWDVSKIALHAFIWKRNGGQYEYVNATSEVHEAEPVEE